MELFPNIPYGLRYFIYTGFTLCSFLLTAIFLVIAEKAIQNNILGTQLFVLLAITLNIYLAYKSLRNLAFWIQSRENAGPIINIMDKILITIFIPAGFIAVILTMIINPNQDEKFNPSTTAKSYKPLSSQA